MEAKNHTQAIFMFNLFKPRFHEPVARQRAEVLKRNPRFFADLVLAGADCDELPNRGDGTFGESELNPIPVNGALGVTRYFFKLRTAQGLGSYFHRICTLNSPVSKHKIDAYEIVSLDGLVWNILFFDIYHPRRSNFAPQGYILTPYDPKLDVLGLFGYGSSNHLENFPHDIPDALKDSQYPEAFVRRCAEGLSGIQFCRPAVHVQRLRDVLARADNVRMRTKQGGWVLLDASAVKF
jgi:hypothetical protein